MLTYVEAEDEDGSDHTKAAPRLDADDGEEAGMRTFAHACSRMLTYANIFSRMPRLDADDGEEAGMLTYADVC
jgi:hypothetical protein